MTLLQKARYKAIVEGTKDLFLSQGINEVTIADIASHLSVGEATLYRYFGKKQTLMIEVGIVIWEEVYQALKQRPLKNTAYKNLESFYNFFLEYFEKYPEFFRLVDEFDLTVIQLGITSGELEDYEKVIFKFKEIFNQFFEMGRLDGSIKPDIDLDLFYYTSNHALISLCKKLATQSHILSYESQMEEITQIQYLIQIYLYYIYKGEKSI